MQPSAPETMSATMLDAPGSAAVLRLVVRNHPGVMSHVCGLFARRGFNVDGIVCLPIGDTTRSVILLVVNEDDRLEQLIRQLGKLEDVLDVRRAPEAQTAFAAVARWMDSVTGQCAPSLMHVGTLPCAKPNSRKGAMAGIRRSPV